MAAFPSSYPAAFGQSLTFGVIAGSNLTDDVRSGRLDLQGGTLLFDPGTRRFIIGLKIEHEFARNWAVEFNALHRELKSTMTTIVSPPIELPGGNKISALGPFTQTLTTWEFPILAKYRFPFRKLHPFLTVGPSFRPAGTGTGLTHTGITAGGGAEFRVAGFRIAPALRYTRWASKDLLPTGAPLVNQVEFLAGIDRPSAASGVGAFGRRLSIGVIAGIGLGRDFETPGSNFQYPAAESNSGMVGTMIEASFARNWAVEASGLYRPLHGTDIEFGRRVRFAHLTWEFPVLLKYRLSMRMGLRPFVEGGPSFRAEGNLNLQPASHYGVAVGAGLEKRFGWLKISPMVRYTRWIGDATGSTPRTRVNQTQILVSFAY